MRGLLNVTYIPLLAFNFALVRAVRKIHENQQGLNLNGLCQTLVYAYDVNFLGKKNCEKYAPFVPYQCRYSTTKYMSM
jgi:hypothetical protein